MRRFTSLLTLLVFLCISSIATTYHPPETPSQCHQSPEGGTVLCCACGTWNGKTSCNDIPIKCSDGFSYVCDDSSLCSTEYITVNELCPSGFTSKTGTDNQAYCVSTTTGVCYNYPAANALAPSCSACGALPEADQCCPPTSSGQSVSSVVIAQNPADSYCSYGAAGCKTLVTYPPNGKPTTQTAYTSTACPCGAESDYCPPCGDNQTLSNDKSYCIDNTTHQCSGTLTWNNGTSTASATDACSTCGVDDSYCCAQGQTLNNVNGDAFCTDSSDKCYEMAYSNGKPVTNPGIYTKNTCSECGMYPSSECPTCDNDQTTYTPAGSSSMYCVGSDHVCKTTLIWQNNASKQYIDPSCSPCGLDDPDANCCGKDQTLVTNGDESFCQANNDNTCFTLAYINGAQAQQASYTSGSCSACGKYPSTSCSPCDDTQSLKSIKNIKGQTQNYCVDTSTHVCYSKQVWANDKPTQNRAPDCSVCGLDDPEANCCASGQTLQAINGEYFCTDNSNNTCKTLAYDSNGNQTSQKDYTTGSCSDCGKYPSSACPKCTDSQAKQSIKNVNGQSQDYCVDKNAVCYGLLTWDKGTSSQDQDPSCSVCGLADPDKNCCASGQTLVSLTNGENFCTDNDSSTPGYCRTMAFEKGKQSTQQSYAKGSCSLCGRYDTSKCCAANQTLLDADSSPHCVVKTAEGLGGACLKIFNGSESANTVTYYSQGSNSCCHSGYYSDQSENNSCPPVQ